MSRRRRLRDVLPASTRQRVKERAHAVAAAHPPDRRARRAIAGAVDVAASELRRRRFQGATVVGVALVRDEIDLIATTVEQVLVEGADVVVVFDHGSVDGTTELLTAMAEHLDVIHVPFDVEGYYQAALMTRTSRMLAAMDVKWVLPFDADELWFATEGSIEQTLAHTSANVVRARVFDHLPGPRDSGEESAFLRMEHRRRAPSTRPKVVFRPSRSVFVHQGNHEVVRWGRRADGLEVRHFPVRSPGQLEQKLEVGRAAMRRTRIPSSLKGAWGVGDGPVSADVALKWGALLDAPDRVLDPATRYCCALAGPSRPLTDER